MRKSSFVYRIISVYKYFLILICLFWITQLTNKNDIVDKRIFNFFRQKKTTNFFMHFLWFLLEIRTLTLLHLNWVYWVPRQCNTSTRGICQSQNSGKAFPSERRFWHIYRDLDVFRSHNIAFDRCIAQIRTIFLMITNCSLWNVNVSHYCFGPVYVSALRFVHKRFASSIVLSCGTTVTQMEVHFKTDSRQWRDTLEARLPIFAFFFFFVFGNFGVVFTVFI